MFLSQSKRSTLTFSLSPTTPLRSALERPCTFNLTADDSTVPKGTHMCMHTQKFFVECIFREQNRPVCWTNALLVDFSQAVWAVLFSIH
mmetsp:Transcript_2115/g.4459  ORF Transcript_2115/g.4459 Transcript_2115/m.4459 type:complete len:89 (-) Transcript_2115:2202-2468(-)